MDNAKALQSLHNRISGKIQKNGQILSLDLNVDNVHDDVTSGSRHSDCRDRKCSVANGKDCPWYIHYTASAEVEDEQKRRRPGSSMTSGSAAGSRPSTSAQVHGHTGTRAR